MAVKGVGLVDEVKWEGASTIGFHMIYAVLVSTNPHDPEVYGGFDIEGVSPGISQASLDAALENALKAQLENEHGVEFGIFDTVRVMGASITGIV